MFLNYTFPAGEEGGRSNRLPSLVAEQAVEFPQALASRVIYIT